MRDPAIDPAPLILTLALAAAAQAGFDRLRRAHFPPERNVLPAHVTLFHHLPAERLESIVDTLRQVADAQSPFPVTVAGLRSLGRGVAYTLDSIELTAVRAALAQNWAASLTAQDRQRFQPHVTVQNKVDPTQARALLARLQAAFNPFSILATGLLLWRYRGGPWEAAGAFPFTGRPADPSARRHR